METFDRGDLFEKQEVKERIEGLLRIFKEHEIVEITEHGEVIAHVVPTNKPQPSVEQNDAAAWADLKGIASELDPYWPKHIDAVEIVRDIRRSLSLFISPKHTAYCQSA